MKFTDHADAKPCSRGETYVLTLEQKCDLIQSLPVWDKVKEMIDKNSRYSRVAKFIEEANVLPGCSYNRVYHIVRDVYTYLTESEKRNTQLEEHQAEFKKLGDYVEPYEGLSLLFKVQMSRILDDFKDEYNNKRLSKSIDRSMETAVTILKTLNEIRHG